MAKINWPDIGELTTVDASSIGKAVIIPAKEAFSQVRFALTGNLTIRDNAYAAIVTLGYQGNSTQTLTTGTEYTFQNPLKTTPVGFTPIKAVNASGTALVITGAEFNTARTDGLMGVTVNFDLNHTGPCLIKTASATQSITSNLFTTITGWDVTKFSRGSIITDDGSTFTVSEAGTYAVNLEVGFQSSVTYSQAEIDIVAGSLRQLVYLPTNFTDGPFLISSFTMQLAAGGTIIAKVLQVNAAAANRTISNGVNTGRTIAIHRLYNDTTPAGIVTGILWGG